MKTIFTLITITAVALVAGCAVTPEPGAGATAASSHYASSHYSCTQGRYGGSAAMANCDRGFTENSR